MKKTFLCNAISTIALTFLFGLVDDKASAASAPSLTDLQIIGLGSDGSNGQLESIDFNQTTATAPLSGQYTYIAVYLKGYASNGQQVKIYSGSTDVSNYATNYKSDTYLTDSGGVVWGCIRYYKVPLSQLTNSLIKVKASNYRDFTKVFYDTVYFTKN